MAIFETESLPAMFNNSIPPDITVVCAASFVIIGVHLFQKQLLGPMNSVYRSLSPLERYDWDQRLLNLLFQAAQTLFNLYILFWCEICARFPLYGYTAFSHMGFLCISVFYLYDSILTLHNPKQKHPGFWIAHHLFAVGMLAWLTGIQKTSARPAATFLVSSAGHITHEVQWFLRATKTSKNWVNNLLGIFCSLVIAVTCVAPPPYLIMVSARRRGVTFSYMFRHLMRWPCTVTFWIIWAPHCALLLIQIRKTAQYWAGSRHESLNFEVVKKEE